LLALAATSFAADGILEIVAPVDGLPPSTLNIAEPPSAIVLLPPVEATPTMTMLSVTSPIDLAALVDFAQATEEIAGQPEAPVAGLFRPITQVTVDVALPEGVLPGQPGTEPVGHITVPRPQFDDPRLWGGWAQVTYQWASTALCHRPLYFEQVNLERYGYGPHPLLQPAFSGAHFFLTIPTLPYKLVAQPPRECVYTLGYYRPGSSAPRRWHHVNWDPTAATVEGMLATGLVFLIP
jgi:hypothetical protein